MELTEDELKPGLVLGRYELLVPVAKGGMAQVWAARLSGTRGFQKTVAIKTMLPNLTEDPQFEGMFLDEAALASRVRHPNAVEIMDLGEDAGILYLVMEWIDGEPLSIVMKHALQKGGMPIKIAVRIVMQACAGLHAAHELKDDSGKPVGLVHRDVSPQNILVTYTGVVKVVDFGVAKATGRVSAETSAGQIKGKAAYMSPEQATGGEIDRRTDLFAMGILLYMMTTGKHPFRRENSAQTLTAICSDDPIKPPSAVVAGYPRELEKIVLKTLSKRPADRFQTGNALQKALDNLPSTWRAGTDDEVAEFMKSLLSERMLKRQALIQKALRDASRREEIRLSPDDITEVPDESSLGSLTPLSGVSQLSIYGPHSRVSNTGVGVAVVPEPVPPPHTSDATPSAPRSGMKVAALAGLLLAVVTGVGVYMVTSRRTVTVVSGAAPPQPIAAPGIASAGNATATPAPEASMQGAVDPPINVVELDFDQPETGSPKRSSARKSTSTVAAAKPAASKSPEQPKPVTQPAPSGTKPFVSPVRTVDF